MDRLRKRLELDKEYPFSLPTTMVIVLGVQLLVSVLSHSHWEWWQLGMFFLCDILVPVTWFLMRERRLDEFMDGAEAVKKAFPEASDEAVFNECREAWASVGRPSVRLLPENEEE